MFRHKLSDIEISDSVLISIAVISINKIGSYIYITNEIVNDLTPCFRIVYRVNGAGNNAYTTFSIITDGEYYEKTNKPFFWVSEKSDDDDAPVPSIERIHKWVKFYIKLNFEDFID